MLAIDNVEASLRTAQMVRQHYPHVPIYARSRHRRHTHQLMDFGVKIIRRETFLSSLDLTREVLRGLGLSERDVRFAVEPSRRTDRQRLYEDYKHYTDLEKLQARASTSRRSWRTCSRRTRPSRRNRPESGRHRSVRGLRNGHPSPGSGSLRIAVTELDDPDYEAAPFLRERVGSNPPSSFLQ